MTPPLTSRLRESARLLRGLYLYSENQPVKLIDKADSTRIAAELAEAADALEAEKARKDSAYAERNQVVASLARLFPSGTARTAIEGWSDDWHGCVYIDLPTGQVSWHFHDSQAHLFAGLPTYQGEWDGHDTPEKYRRLAAMHAAPAAKTDALEAGPWMPIETAPKDKALLTHDGVSYNLAHFNTALGKWIANHPYDERLPREPIRWTLLPPHPRSGTAAQVAQEGAPGVALPAKPFPAPGKWFPVDITGTRPMREVSPGKWELAEWPSDDGVTEKEKGRG